MNWNSDSWQNVASTSELPFIRKIKHWRARENAETRLAAMTDASTDPSLTSSGGGGAAGGQGFDEIIELHL